MEANQWRARALFPPMILYFRDKTHSKTQTSSNFTLIFAINLECSLKELIYKRPVEYFSHSIYIKNVCPLNVLLFRLKVIHHSIQDLGKSWI